MLCQYVKDSNQVLGIIVATGTNKVGFALLNPRPLKKIKLSKEELKEQALKRLALKNASPEKKEKKPSPQKLLLKELKTLAAERAENGFRANRRMLIDYSKKSQELGTTFSYKCEYFISCLNCMLIRANLYYK